MLNYTMEEIKSMSTVTEEIVDQYIESSEVGYAEVAIGNKKCTTTYLLGPNNFVFSATNCALDVKNYSKDIGLQMNMEEIRGQVWKYLAFYVSTVKENN